MINNLINILINTYPEAECSLNFTNPLELLISVILSAQSTDAKINKLTPKLFERFKTANDYAECDLSELEEYVKSSGFYKNKAKNIILCCKDLIDRFSGVVPSSFEDLVSLAGVGPKVADCIMLFGYHNGDSFPVDTWIEQMYNHHFSPLSNREQIRKNLVEMFGELSGFAQQYLFYYTRENLKK